MHRYICYLVVVCLLCNYGGVESKGFSPLKQTANSRMTGGSVHMFRQSFEDNTTTTTGSTSTSGGSTSTTGGPVGCCGSCSQYAECKTDICACECLAGFSGTGATCEPLGDPSVQGARWDYVAGTADNWGFTPGIVHSTSQFSIVVWTDMIVSTYGSSYCWSSNINPLGGEKWGLAFNSIDNNNAYLVIGTPSGIEFSVNYKSNLYTLTKINFDWKLRQPHELKICVDHIYYNFYVDGVIYPSDTTFSTNLLESGGVVGLVAADAVLFNDVKFVSTEHILLQISECATTDSITELLSKLFSVSSFFVHPTTDQDCQKRFAAEAVSIGVTLYGNSTISAKALNTILQITSKSENSIFSYAGLTVNVQNANLTNLEDTDIIGLDLPADAILPPEPERGLTAAELGGIIGGGVGFIIIILVAVIVVQRRKRRTPKRKHADTMKIPKYPTVPIDRSMKRNNKPQRHSSLLDLFGRPQKSASTTGIMMDVAGDV